MTAKDLGTKVQKLDRTMSIDSGVQRKAVAAAITGASTAKKLPTAKKSSRKALDKENLSDAAQKLINKGKALNKIINNSTDPIELAQAKSQLEMIKSGLGAKKGDKFSVKWLYGRESEKNVYLSIERNLRASNVSKTDWSQKTKEQLITKTVNYYNKLSKDIQILEYGPRTELDERRLSQLKRDFNVLQNTLDTKASTINKNTLSKRHQQTLVNYANLIEAQKIAKPRNLEDRYQEFEEARGSMEYFFERNTTKEFAELVKQLSYSDLSKLYKFFKSQVSIEQYDYDEASEFILEEFNTDLDELINIILDNPGTALQMIRGHFTSPTFEGFEF